MKTTLSKLIQKDESVDYVVAEYHAKTKKRATRDESTEVDYNTQKDATGEYMQIDKLHQKN